MITIGLSLLSSTIALAAISSPAPGTVITGPPPLHVTACRLAVEHHGPRGSVEQVAVVSFSNDRDAAADVARFTVNDAGGVAKAFTARGSFTRGVLIADRILPAEALRDMRASGGDDGSDCMLRYVHFVDGSTWTSPP